MDAFRPQSKLLNSSPVITNVCNFTKPAGDMPALLTFDEACTLFHEFGHALHGLLSECTYPSVAGTSVARDFVELPSQVMENWAGDPEVLKIYTHHWQTGEPMPQELIDKIQNSSHFNQGFVVTEFMSAALLDMAYHTIQNSDPIDAEKFEKEVLDKIGLIPEIRPLPQSLFRTYFQRRLFGRLLCLHLGRSVGCRCFCCIQGNRRYFQSGESQSFPGKYTLPGRFGRSDETL